MTRFLLRIAASLFVVAAIFKMLHWPGAAILLMSSWPFAVFGISMRATEYSGFSLRVATFWLGSVLLFTGYIMKIMHWPGANAMAVAGLATSGAYWALGGWQTALERWKNLFGSGMKAIVFSLAAAVTFVGIMFKLQHWPFANILILSGAVAWLVYLWVPSKPNVPVKLGVLDEEVS